MRCELGVRADSFVPRLVGLSQGARNPSLTKSLHVAIHMAKCHSPFYLYFSVRSRYLLSSVHTFCTLGHHRLQHFLNHRKQQPLFIPLGLPLPISFSQHITTRSSTLSSGKDRQQTVAQGNKTRRLKTKGTTKARLHLNASTLDALHCPSYSCRYHPPRAAPASSKTYLHSHPQ